MARRRSAVRIGVTGLGQREELAPGVFTNTFYRGCTPGFVRTEEGIVLVDAPLIPTQAIDWRSQIEEEFPGEAFLLLIDTVIAAMPWATTSTSCRSRCWRMSTPTKKCRATLKRKLKEHVRNGFSASRRFKRSSTTSSSFRRI